MGVSERRRLLSCWKPHFLCSRKPLPTSLTSSASDTLSRSFAQKAQFCPAGRDMLILQTFLPTARKEWPLAWVHLGVNPSGGPLWSLGSTNRPFGKSQCPAPWTSKDGSQENAKGPERAYQASTKAEDGCVILPSIDLAAVEAVAQVWGRRAALLSPERRGSQVHLGVARSQEGRVGAQVQLEDLAVGADSVVGPERRGLQRLGAALPPAEVVALWEHFAELIDPRGGHHFVGGQCPHQGFCNHSEKAVEPLPVSNSPAPNFFNQTSQPESRGPRSPYPRRGATKEHTLASARAHTHTCALRVCLPAFPQPRFAPPSPSRDPDTQGPQQHLLLAPLFAPLPPPTRAPRAPAPPCSTRPRRVVPGGKRVPRARFLETPRSRNLRGCLGLADPGVPRVPAGPGSPSGRNRSPRLRPPVPLGHAPHHAAEGAPRWPYPAWGGSELPKTWWWRARAGRAAPSATWPPAWFHRGDPDRGGQPETPAAPPASPRSAASPPSRLPLSAPAAAAPQQPPEQQPRPRAGPSRHTASLRSLSHCFIALQPRSLRLAVGSLAPLPAPAQPSEALSLRPAQREEATRPSRNGANIATPGLASWGGEPAPRGRARPISWRRGPGSPSGALPAPSP